MGSWLYRTTSRVPDDGHGDDPAAPVKPFWASGPRNPVIAEVWLHSARALVQDEGECDPRYSDHFQYGPISGPGADNEAARLELWTLQENRTAWDPIAKAPDLRFRDTARSIGGCPGVLLPMLTALPRRPQTGLAHAFAQESLAEQLCALPAEGSAPAEITVASVLEHQMRLVYGRSPTPDEIADYEAAFASCTGDECTPDGIVNAVCVALLGGAEMVFH